MVATRGSSRYRGGGARMLLRPRHPGHAPTGGSPGPTPAYTSGYGHGGQAPEEAGARVTMLMKLGLLSRPAMSKLPTPPVCGERRALVSGHRTMTPAPDRRRMIPGGGVRLGSREAYGSDVPSPSSQASWPDNTTSKARAPGLIAWEKCRVRLGHLGPLRSLESPRGEQFPEKNHPPVRGPHPQPDCPGLRWGCTSSLS